MNLHGSDRYSAESAGIEPGKLNPVVVEAMKEKGIDISQNRTKSVDEFLEREDIFDFVITVCDETSAELCPVFPGGAKRLHWGFRDPSALQGSFDEKLAETRVIRDEIEGKVKEWLSSN
ncbi:MAG: Arsenate reductase [Ignavibacteriaceae bacterium]|nr:Arsenate reductase [Ignavibacteriaceae bacterium]